MRTKRFLPLLSIVAATAACLSPPSASAQEAEEGFVESFSNFFRPNWEKDFSATVGVKVWMNDWTRDSFLSDRIGFNFADTDIIINTSDTRPDTEISDTEVTPIPQASLRYRRLILVGSYYPETDFDFPDSEATITAITDPDAGAVEQITRFSGSAERKEWDIALGVNILFPYFTILGGYKEIDQTTDQGFTETKNFYDSNGVLTGTNTRSVSGTGKININGPFIGFAGSAPFGNSGFGMYGSYAHGFMDTDITDSGEPTHTYDADYDVAELAVFYAPDIKQYIKQWLPQIPLFGTSLYLGYRFQNIETEFSASLPDII
jgi:hypothetical protein